MDNVLPNINKKIAQNAALQVVGKASGTLLSLLTFAILVNHLGTDGFGALTIALNFGTMLAVLVDFGLTLTTTQMIAEPDADEERILGNMLSLRVISAALFLGAGCVAVLGFPYTAEIKIAAMLSCASFFFGTVASMYVGVFQKRLAVRSAVVAELANRIVVCALAFWLTTLATSVVLAAAVFAAGGLVQLIAIRLATARHVTVRWRLEPAMWAAIASRSWPIGVSIALNLIYLRGDIFFMSLLGTTHTDIGLYGSAYKVMDVVTTIPVMLMGLMLPLLTYSWHRKAHDEFRSYLQRTLDGMALIALPFALGTALVGGRLLALVKPDLIHTAPLFLLLGPAAAVVFFGSLFGHAIVALQKQRQMIWGYALVAVLATVGYIVAIPTYGTMGAALVTLLAETLIGTLTALVVLRTSQARLTVRTAAVALLASVLMGLAIVAAWQLHVLILIVVGIIVYVCALWLMGGPSPKRMLRLFMPAKV